MVIGVLLYSYFYLLYERFWFDFCLQAFLGFLVAVAIGHYIFSDRGVCDMLDLFCEFSESVFGSLEIG